MKAIRGATTINSNTPNEIKSAVKELLERIIIDNSLLLDDIIYIMFSSTEDVTAYYPAKAARECGFSGIPLYSSLEPCIENSLRGCIRVLFLADNLTKAKHVYLRGAAILRTDLTKIYSIALDGPAGSGKSTIAKALAKDLNILYLDTGAMYRTCALRCILNSVDFDDHDAVSQCIGEANISVEYKEGRQILVLDGVDVTDNIRTDMVSQGSSKVAVVPFVRQKMVELQRAVALKTSCVLDGRDIGTVVLPNANFKFFITASAEVRAKRRYEENIKKGYDCNYEQVLFEIRERDLRDSTRQTSPLKQAEDAILVDTSNMSAQEVIAYIKAKIQEKI